MDTLPAEILPFLVPDPDTLGAMLRVCSKIYQNLTNGGSYTFMEGNEYVKVSNTTLTFTMISVGWRPHCTKTYGGNSRCHSSPCGTHSKYIRYTRHSVSLTGGIGWDYVKYDGKLEFICDVPPRPNASPRYYLLGDEYFYILWHNQWNPTGCRPIDSREMGKLLANDSGFAVYIKK